MNEKYLSAIADKERYFSAYDQILQRRPELQDKKELLAYYNVLKSMFLEKREVVDLNSLGTTFMEFLILDVKLQLLFYFWGEDDPLEEKEILDIIESSYSHFYRETFSYKNPEWVPDPWFLRMSERDTDMTIHRKDKEII